MNRPPSRSNPLRAIVKIAAVVALLFAVNQAFQYVAMMLDFEAHPDIEAALQRGILVAAIVYTLALAVPFVPGVEIGLMMMIVIGPKIALIVYLCTVAGLCLAYGVGRVVPTGILIGLARDLRLRRTETMLHRLAEMNAAERLAALEAAVPRRIVQSNLSNRYVVLAVLINLPGNFVLGGGGGLAMAAGFSRVYSSPMFLVTVLIAVSPVPVALAIFGPSILDW